MGRTHNEGAINVTGRTKQTPPAFAKYWAHQLGSKESTLIRLQGGINNKVYQCGDNHRWVIKGYPPLTSGLKDRMQAEVEFLRYAAKAAPGFTPNIIHVDEDRRCVVLEHITGEVFPEGGSPTEAAVILALDFLRQLNQDHLFAAQFISLDAAEGFLSLTEHILNIRQRLDSMSCDHLPAEIKPRSKSILAYLQSKYERIRAITETLISKDVLRDRIRPEERIVSPGDFGFHNAIRAPVGIRFIDFEFAGWDDPAKTLIDFLLQPRMPLNQAELPLDRVQILAKYPDYQRRYEALVPIISLKWSCIILSVLNPDRMREITQIDRGQEVADLISRRVSTAETHIEKHLSQEL